MINKYYILMISLPLLFSSTIIAISSNSFFIIWMSMEMNMMSFMPMLLMMNFLMKNYTIKYFIIQSISSMFLLFLMISMNSQLLLNKFIIYLMMLILLTKLGMPPMFTWFPQLMMNLSWTNTMILLTWQKIIPFFLMNSIINFLMPKIILFYIMVTLYTSLFMSINQISLKMIMCFSSMIYMCWMILIMTFNEMIMKIFLMIYCTLSLNLMMMFKMLKINYLNNMMYLKINFLNKMIMFLIMFSMMNLPPTLGFSMKWISMIFMNKMINFNVMFFLMLNSVIMMYYYMRIYIHMTITNHKKKFNYKRHKKLNYKMTLLNFILTSLLMIMEFM